MRQEASLDQCLNRMSVGDVLAFGGTSIFSRGIKAWTRSPVSHVAIVMGGAMAESAENGVAILDLAHKIANYRGDVWWLPLGDIARHHLMEAEFQRFITEHKGFPYDNKQCWLLPAGFNREDWAAFFCSEFASAALETGGVIENVNTSAVTPINLCCFDIYGSDYWQIKGEPREIGGHGTVDPTGWRMVRQPLFAGVDGEIGYRMPRE